MKKIIISVAIASLLLMSSGCKKEVLYGPVMFWTNVDEGTVTITINGQTGTITGYVTGGVPSCGNAVSANFTLPEGYYSYSVSAPPSPAYPTGYTLTGTAHAVVNQCQAYQL